VEKNLAIEEEASVPAVIEQKNDTDEEMAS
jgi:hypothetical protein